MGRLIKVHVSLLCEACSPQHVLGTLEKLLPHENAKSKVWQNLLLYVHCHTISHVLASRNYTGSG